MLFLVEVGHIECELFLDERGGVDAVLAVRDGLVTVDEARPLSREGQHRIAEVGNGAVDVEIHHVDVPVVFVAAVAGQRRVDDAGVVVEAEIEAVLEVLQVVDGYHHLLETLVVVLGHEGFEGLPWCAPDVVPSGVGHGDEHRVARDGDAASRDVGERVGDDVIHVGIAAAESPNGVAGEERIDLHVLEDFGHAEVVVFDVLELLMFGGDAEFEHQRVLCLGRIAVALWLVAEAEIQRVGRGEGAWRWLEDGVEADACRGEVFGDEGIADGVFIHAAMGIEDIEGDSVAVGCLEGEAVVHQGVVVGPFRLVGIDC